VTSYEMECRAIIVYVVDQGGIDQRQCIFGIGNEYSSGILNFYMIRRKKNLAFYRNFNCVSGVIVDQNVV
jgi:hypothetical protein